MIESILQFGGRLHPMVLHAPIGLLLALVALELAAKAARKSVGRETRLALAWLAAAAAAASVVSGLLLNREGGYPSDTVGLHQWLAIGAAGAVLLAAVAAQARAGAVYGLFLAVSAGLVIPAGHLGASMTHGEDFLFEPFGRAERVAEADAGRTTEGTPGSSTPGSTYARVIAPILADHCLGCHGAKKHKGGLSLHTPEAIVAGGDSGVPIVPGDVEASEMIRRIRLPIDDDDHMPPPSKDQPTLSELEALESWIRSGASFESDDPQLAGSGPASEAGRSGPAASAGAIDPAVVATMRARLVHVEPVARDSNLLVVDTAAVAAFITDSEAAELLGPAALYIADLSLARTGITDASMDVIASMPSLRRLSLSATNVGNAGLARLAGHATLAEMVLSQTSVTDAGLESLASMPGLVRVYLWHTGVTSEGVAALRARRPELLIDIGATAESVVLEAEPAVTRGAAPETAPKADSLRPVNSACPVSGKPIDPRFAVVHGNRVIGFCCKDCVAKFLEAPSTFTVP